MGEIRRRWFTVKVTDPKTGEICNERRQTKTWEIRYRDANGRRHEESGFTKKGEAVRVLALREGAAAKGEPVGAALARYTFDQAMSAVEAHYELKARRSTVSLKRRIRLHLLPFFTGRKLASIGTDDAAAYATARLAEGAKPATVNRELAIMRLGFSLAIKAKKLAFKPAIEMLGEDNIRRGFFERGEFEAVRNNLPEHLRGVVTFAYLTGWRVPSEVLTLRWSQVDRDAKTMRLEPGMTKNGKGRTLPYALLPELDAVIEAAWAEHERLKKAGTISPVVFCQRDGQPIRDCRKAWETACTKAGVPGKLLHDFRRTAVRNLTRAGVSQKVAMGVTGHLTPSVFDRYDITTEDDIREGLGKLAGLGADRRQSPEPARIFRHPSSL